MKTVMLLASEEICNILKDAFRDKYVLLPCSNPTAVRELLHQAPDALILDLFLPGTDGLTFLRENPSTLPPVIVVLTCVFSSLLMKELATLGVSAVIRIPFPLDCLERQLTALL